MSLRHEQTMDRCQLGLLDREILTSVCSQLDPITLAQFSCTSRDLRDVCVQNCLWEGLSKHRWRHINADLYARAENSVGSQQGSNSAKNTDLRQQLREPSIDFCSLYAKNNGWTPLNLQKIHQHVFPSNTWEFCVSRAPASKFCSGAGDAVYTVDKTVQLWSTGDSSKAGCTLIVTGSNHPSIAERVYSITELAAGIVATGGYGEICLHDLRPDAAASTHAGATWHNGRRYLYLLADKAITKALQQVAFMQQQQGLSSFVSVIC